MVPSLLIARRVCVLLHWRRAPYAQRRVAARHFAALRRGMRAATDAAMAQKFGGGLSWHPRYAA